MHPNWKALSTVDFRYKIFVTPTSDETNVKNKSDVKNVTSNITGEEATSFYKEIIETPINPQHNLKNEIRRKTLKKVTKDHPPVAQRKPFDKNLLFKAVMEDNYYLIKTMNFDSNQINSCDQYGWTALMMAACEGFLNTFLLLLELGADLNVADRQGNTAQSLALKKKKQNILQAIENYKSDLNDSDSDECVIVDNAEKEPFYCDLCKLKFKESSKKEHRTSTLHQFNARKYKHARCYGIPESNKGFKIMVKNGWDRENGLGPNKSGHLFPIKTVIRKQRSGLGTQQNKAKVTHFNSFDMDAIKYRPQPAPRTRKDINNEFVRGKYLERKLRIRKIRIQFVDKMTDDSKKTMEILISTERVADKILTNKQEIIALDKRRQDTREAIRDLKKSDEEKTWITIGSMLVKLKRDRALELLTKDQNKINVEINKLRSDQKILVNEHRDLEHQSPLHGFDLKPMSSNEVAAFRANLTSFL